MRAFRPLCAGMVSALPRQTFMMARQPHIAPLGALAARSFSIARSPTLFMSSDMVPIIDKANLEKRLKDSEPYLLIDVREPHELVHGMIPTAINIPLRDLPTAFGLRPGEFQRKYGAPKPLPETEMFFYCRAGPRAMSAAQNVNSMGYEKTVCYYGSYTDWFGRSYPL
jgi:rhodanese-related sulfurtransferase